MYQALNWPEAFAAVGITFCICLFFIAFIWDDK